MGISSLILTTEGRGKKKWEVGQISKLLITIYLVKILIVIMKKVGKTAKICVNQMLYFV
jgi:hypothetical protein